VTSTYQHRRYLRAAIAVLLALVLCWVSERASLAEGVHHGGPAVEREQTDTSPVGKPVDSTSEALEGESVEDSDFDALLVVAASIEFVRSSSFRQFDHGRELNDWRVRSTIGARGPPIA
jgi:hypothetical protein